MRSNYPTSKLRILRKPEKKVCYFGNFGASKGKSGKRQVPPIHTVFRQK